MTSACSSQRTLPGSRTRPVAWPWIKRAHLLRQAMPFVTLRWNHTGFGARNASSTGILASNQQHQHTAAVLPKPQCGSLTSCQRHAMAYSGAVESTCSAAQRMAETPPALVSELTRPTRGHSRLVRALANFWCAPRVVTCPMLPQCPTVCTGTGAALVMQIWRDVWLHRAECQADRL